MGVEMEMCGNPRATRIAVTLTLTLTLTLTRIIITLIARTTTTCGVRATERSAEQGRSERPAGVPNLPLQILAFPFDFPLSDTVLL